MQKMIRKVTNGVFRSGDGVLVDYSFVDNGSRSNVAFANGWGTTTYSEWSRQRRLREHNLVFFNNRGNGSSGLGSEEYLHACAEDINTLCKTLDIRKVNLVGHSMGGLITTLFYNQFRDGISVESMTFVSVPAGDPVSSFPFRGFLPKHLDTLIDSYENGILSALAAAAENSAIMEKAAYLVTRGGGVSMHPKAFSSLYHNFLSRRKAVVDALRSMIRYGPQIGKSMEDIRSPAMIIHAEGDFFVSPESAYRIHSRISGSELHILRKATHAPMFEEPQTFNRLMLEFLSKSARIKPLMDE